MKASKLVKVLKSMIVEHGDAEVAFKDENNDLYIVVDGVLQTNAVGDEVENLVDGDLFFEVW